MAFAEPRATWIKVAYLAMLLALVGAFVVSLNRSHWETRRVQAVVGRSGTASLEVVVAHSRCPGDGVRARVVHETRDSVELRAEHGISGDCDDIGLTTTAVLQLDRPLADRLIRVVQPESAVDTEQVMACRIDGAASDRCRTTTG